MVKNHESSPHVYHALMPPDSLVLQGHLPELPLPIPQGDLGGTLLAVSPPRCPSLAPSSKVPITCSQQAIPFPASQGNSSGLTPSVYLRLPLVLTAVSTDDMS